MLIQFFEKVFEWKYSLTVLAFLAWIFFFDKNKFSYQWEIQKQINSLENEKNYYLQGIENNRKLIHGLLHSPDTLEMIAREQYLMKKDFEEIFVLADESLYRNQ
ncbi:MAG: hypothetical protein N3F09_06570 [Bacteroidia bacterium]|nr:hypothetical protein [Bacteroidia bacterium]